MRKEPIQFLHSDQSMFSERQFKEHYKLYERYVKNIYDFPTWLHGSELKEYKRNETLDIAGASLHELFFSQLVEQKEVPVNGINDMEDYRESIPDRMYSDWVSIFSNVCLISKGWAIYGYDFYTHKYRMFVLEAHNNGLSPMFIPLVTVDLYEHAYFIDYGTEKAKYIDDIIASINWGVIRKRKEEINKLLKCGIKL